MEIDLSKPLPGQIEFHAARGRAIDAYAGVEAALSRLLSSLMATDEATASIIFYKITNTSSRNQITETLLEKKWGDSFSHYWSGIPETHNKRGMLQLIRDLDGMRNKLVHWHSLANLDNDTISHALAKPAFWTEDRDPQLITVDEILEFTIKADWVTRSLNSFVVFTANPALISEPLRTTWRDIFQQPCTYPPADSHPLSLISKEQTTPPLSFW